MIDVINKIFLESGFEKKESDLNVTFYLKKENEFYFTLDLEISEILKINNLTDFEKLDKYILLKEYFDSTLKKTSSAIEKNTSLIIFVKCETFNSIETSKQNILLLEEDEYFFKKYIVLYTDEAKGKYDLSLPILKQLKDIVNSEENYSKYENEVNEIGLDGYILTLQLFIKLPFLRLEFDTKSYVSLESKIESNLYNEKSLLFYLLNKDNAKEIKNFEYDKEGKEELLDEIINKIKNNVQN